MTPLNESTSPLYTRAVDLLERIQDRFCKAKVSEDVSAEEDWLIKEVAEFKHFALQERPTSPDKAGVREALYLAIAEVCDYSMSRFLTVGQLKDARVDRILSALTPFLPSPQPAPVGCKLNPETVLAVALSLGDHEPSITAPRPPGMPQEAAARNRAAPVGEGTTPRTDAFVLAGNRDRPHAESMMTDLARTLERELADMQIRCCEWQERYYNQTVLCDADLTDLRTRLTAAEVALGEANNKNQFWADKVSAASIERERLQKDLSAAQSELGEVAASASEWMGIAQRRADELVDLRHQLEEARKDGARLDWLLAGGAVLVPNGSGHYTSVIHYRPNRAQIDSARTPKPE